MRQIFQETTKQNGKLGWTARKLVLSVATVAILWSNSALADCKLPPAVPDRIGRALGEVLKISDKSQLAGKYDMILVDYFDRAHWAKVPGIYSLKYMTAYRDPNPRANVPNPNSDDEYNKTRDLRWWQKNHPDWVMYKCPGVPVPPKCEKGTGQGNGANNPAYECYYPNSVDHMPLDVSNPDVRQFLFDAAVGGGPLQQSKKAYFDASGPKTINSILTSGLYDAVSVDNLGSYNVAGRCGIYQNGNWVQKYSGQKEDQKFVADEVDWLNWLRQRVNGAGLCLSGNNYFYDKDPQGFLDIAAALDIVIDEHGFTRNGKPFGTGAAWLQRVNTYRKVTATKPLVVIDYVAPSLAEMRDRKGISWSIANYLLIKGDRTYLVMTTRKEIASDLTKEFPELFIQTGAPTSDIQTDHTLYWRQFANAVAVVNPSRKAGRLNVGNTRWRSLDGKTVTGTVTVEPETALVLTKDG